MEFRILQTFRHKESPSSAFGLRHLNKCHVIAGRITDVNAQHPLLTCILSKNVVYSKKKFICQLVN